MAIIVALFAGLIFGLGITISGMINPAKVINFFDIAGSWDPSLLFVMGGALATTMLGYQLLFRLRQAPIMAPTFALPTATQIDRPLLIGAAVFGLGWGIAGFCPGASLVALGLGDIRTLIFVLAMVCGMMVARLIRLYFIR